ncbi:DUF4400 domain-containing protein [Vibrio breoganii]|uniref:DUF4400 domain-containing protein n=1 Tax=Vibrio breoganii TaxID=553239 RepID=UPI000C833E2F|nr:DUF4400 domain-containing protein [Vibrio breoganii]PMN72730.1 hypothetical protein BCT28_16910 [Vibrio breoganii]PMO77943.1 hypothetical protein BCT00_18060 [Vibrio breoganii]TKF90444.1 DUF4400 domain-containing protein [Vibrio breoganii]
MADEVQTDYSKKPFWLVMFIIVSQIIFLASLVSPESVRESMIDEVQYMRGVYGDSATLSIYDSAKTMSDKVLHESGFAEKTKTILLPEEYRRTRQVEDNKNFNTGFWVIVERVIDGVMVNIEFALLRIYAVKPWLLMAVLVLVASTITGFLHREVKKHGFEYSSPLRHGIARRIIYLLPIIGYLLVVTPIAMPPHVYPIVLAVCGLCVAFMVSNTIKRV